ncbi:MAG: TlpA family protein disulfide reductase, partial [Clostridia bacterium]|nr:TlpA family protein disulfide reductase [Clostridia bacterium]
MAFMLVLVLTTIPGACRPRQQTEGQVAPEFVLPDLAGNQVSLSSLR